MTDETLSSLPAVDEGLVERLHGPVQWGYMCLADGGFIADNAPLEGADTIIRLQVELAEVREALRTVFAMFPNRPDAPGHQHDVAGVWDNNPSNGAMAGQPCERCSQWNHAKAALPPKDDKP